VRRKLKIPRMSELMQEGDDFVDMVKLYDLLRKTDPYKLQQKLPMINHHYEWDRRLISRR